MKKIIFSISLLILISFSGFAQVSLKDQLKKVSYSDPKEYVIGGISVTGIKYLDQTVIVHLTGLQTGDTIMVPGEKITKAIEKLWDQGLFSDVEISADKIINKRIFLTIKLVERPRLSKFSFQGVKKGEADDLRENLKLVKGS